MKKGKTIKTPWDHAFGKSLPPRTMKKVVKKSSNEKYWDERTKLAKRLGKETAPSQFEE